MKSVLKYIKSYRAEAILAPLFKLLEASFELIVPLVIVRIIDVGITNGDIPYVWKMGGVLFLLAAVGLGFSVTAQYFAAKAAIGSASALRSDLFAHIQGFSFATMDKLGVNTMITRMTSDVNQVQNGINMALRLFLRSPFIVFGAAIAAFFIDVKSALIFVVVIPVLFVIVFAIVLGSIPMYKKVQSLLDKVLGITRENLTGVRVIRAFGKEEWERERFYEANTALTNMQKFVGRFSALLNPVTYVCINCALIILLWTGGLQVQTGTLTQGQVVALVNYMSQILVELIKLANLCVTITKAVACANRVADVLAIPVGEQNALTTVVDPEGVLISAEKTDQGGQNVPAVEFRGVSFTYEGAGDEALTDLVFSAGKGETIGIIGGTGSGKSSLVNLIPRYYDVTKGSVLVEGVDVRALEVTDLRKRVITVLQKAKLFRGSVAENLRWGKEDATEEEMWKALSIAQASEFVEQKEGQLHFQIEQNGRNLSGGQKQRLSIARALIAKPEILILDDSASALDFATDAALRKALRENCKDMTVFVVSQRASSIMHADRILVMDDGCIVGNGTHEDLLKNCEVYREIYESQK